MHKVKTLWTNTCPRVAAVYKSACRSCSSQAGSGKEKGKRNYATLAAAEPFLSGSSSVYVEEMYSSWQKDPNSVHKVSTRATKSQGLNYSTSSCFVLSLSV